MFAKAGQLQRKVDGVVSAQITKLSSNRLGPVQIEAYESVKTLLLKLQRRLRGAWTHPLKSVRRKWLSGLLYTLADSEKIFSQRRRERFWSSARKHDPCRSTDLLSVSSTTPGRAIWRIVDTADLDNFSLSDPDGTVIVMPTLDIEQAKRSGDLLLKRAGMRTTLVIVEDTRQIGFAAAINSILPRLEAKYAVYLTDSAFSGINWLALAVSEMEASNTAILNFGSAAGLRRDTEMGIVRLSWAATAQGAGPLHRSACRSEAGIFSKVGGSVVTSVDSVLVDTAAWSQIADPASISHNEDDGLIRVVDVAALGTFHLSDPEGAVVVMPSIDVARAKATAELLIDHAGMTTTIVIAEDTRRQGFVRTLNDVAARLDTRYVVYLAEDALPGSKWLLCAFNRLEMSNKGLLAFNCGKWRGRIAAFGMVRVAWVGRLYGGPILFPGYNAHKADNEITAIARVTDQFVYAADCVLVEIDPAKPTGLVNPEDRALFRDRFRSGFGGAAEISALEPLAAEYFVPMNKKDKHRT